MVAYVWSDKKNLF